jgi:hypothetical protein
MSVYTTLDQANAEQAFRDRRNNEALRLIRLIEAEKHAKRLDDALIAWAAMKIQK